MPELARFPADAQVDAIMPVLRRDGAVIVTGLISSESADEVLAEIQPYIDATPNGRDSFSGGHTTRTGALIARSTRVRALARDTRIRAFADRLLLANCERYQLHLAQAIRLRPGQTAQAIHRDRWAWGTFLSAIEPQLNTIWALTDFTKENGATQVVPGSVDWPDDRVPATEEITWAAMPKGGVLVYTGSVFHGGGANVSQADRVGLNITYSLGWLRQEENQYLSCPPAIARTLDPDLQELIGYSMGSYALGYFTPPLPPGEGPEVVPPQFALRGEAASGLGEPTLLRSIAEKVRD